MSAQWYTKKITGYKVIKLKHEQFLMNTTADDLPLNDLSLTSSSSSSQYNNEAPPNNENTTRRRAIFTSKRRARETNILVMISPPHCCVYESDEQVRQILCSDDTVFVGASGRTIYFWDYYSSEWPLNKIVFDEEIDVVGYGRWFIVKTKSGEIYMSDGSVFFVERLRKESDLPFDITKEKVLDIACGSDTLFLTDKGKVYGYGKNDYFAMGVNDRSRDSEKWFSSNISHIPDKIKRLYCTAYCSFLLTESGHLYVAGTADYGENGLINKADPFVWTRIPSLEDEIVTDVSTGLCFVAVSTQSKRIYVFGYFNFNQFGLSSKYNEINRPTIMDSFSDMDSIQEIICGGYGSLILTKDNSLFIGGKTSLVNSDGRYTEFEWGSIFPEYDKASSILKCGITTGHKLVLAIHQNNISKHFNFKDAWKIGDVVFNHKTI